METFFPDPLRYWPSGQASITKLVTTPSWPPRILANGGKEVAMEHKTVPHGKEETQQMAMLAHLPMQQSRCIHAA